MNTDVMPLSVVRSANDFTDCECWDGVTVIASYHKHKVFSERDTVFLLISFPA